MSESAIVNMWLEEFGEHPRQLKNPRYATTPVQIRDIPFEELCDTVRIHGDAFYWKGIRGKWTEIKTGTADFPRKDLCGGPYFKLTARGAESLGVRFNEGVQYYVCGHQIHFD